MKPAEINKKAVSKSEALAEMWYRGNLSWKLKPNQREMYDLFYTSKHKVQTWLLARRSGKTFTLCLLAIEACIKNPKCIVKFLSPTKLQVNSNMRPIMRQILEDCPEDIKPEFKKQEYTYYFPNGSEIQLAGSESGHAEKLRGGSSVISIVDEAQDVTELKHIVSSILLPTTLTTRGKVILSGTPPKDPDHEFIEYIEEAELRGSLTKKTVYDNPMLTKEDIAELIVELGGATSDAARRELFCELIRDPKSCVIPEFTEELEKEITKEWPRPMFFDSYEAMDLGGKDLTVVLYAYYDYRTDKVIIDDEYVQDFTIKGNHIKLLTEKIDEMEKNLWTNPISKEMVPPYKRVSDINYIVTQEISSYSDNRINFIATKKDNKEAAINNVRLLLSHKKIIINPKCKTLLRHLKNVKWASKNTDEFARSPDDGHYDAVDALIYLIRNIDFKKNPYPAHYELNLRKEDAYYINGESSKNKIREIPKGSTYDTAFKKIFNLKKRW